MEEATMKEMAEKVTVLREMKEDLEVIFPPSDAMTSEVQTIGTYLAEVKYALMQDMKRETALLSAVNRKDQA